MSIESGLKTLLLSDTTVSALIGTRIRPIKLAQGYTLPAVTYMRVSGPRVQAVSEGPIGWCFARYQFDCWADTYSEVRQLSDAIRQVLDGYKGSMTDVSKVGAITLENDMDFFEEETEIYRVILEFIVPYTETP